MSENPLVSVCMITYNHEKYIREAVDGVLKQQASFSIELLISDDHSSDRTTQICRDVAAANPDRIRFIERGRNIGMMPNFLDSLRQCKGKYIALCEGDDRWTDPLKLQRQVEFLEANPDFAICFHRVEIIDESGRHIGHSNPDQKDVATFEDLASGNFMHTLSCVFRNSLPMPFPEWINDSPVGDYPLHLLNARNGKIKYLKEVMGAYRVHEGGVWSLTAQEYRMENWYSLLEVCKNYFAPLGQAGFEAQIVGNRVWYCFHLFATGRYAEFRVAFNKFIRNRSDLPRRSSTALWIRYLLSRSNWVSKMYNTLFAPIDLIPPIRRWD